VTSELIERIEDLEALTRRDAGIDDPGFSKHRGSRPRRPRP
jgi:hypothetical protein